MFNQYNTVQYKFYLLSVFVLLCKEKKKGMNSVVQSTLLLGKKNESKKKRIESNFFNERQNKMIKSTCFKRKKKERIQTTLSIKKEQKINQIICYERNTENQTERLTDTQRYRFLWILFNQFLNGGETGELTFWKAQYCSVHCMTEFYHCGG